MIRITREFDAPVNKVFRAHTDPELFVKWIGPRSTSATINSWECRTGGSWNYTATDCTNDNAYDFYGSFHEVRPNELIVQTFTFGGFPDGVSLERLVFEDLGGGRTRLVGTSLVDSFEGRDAIIASGMEHGVREGYERLDEILAAADG